MRICHMTSAHERFDVRIFHRQCTSLALKGYETYLVATGESCEKNDVHVLGIGKKSNSRFARMIGTSRKVYKKSLELNADLYEIHDPELLPYGIKLLKKGHKVIWDSHEDYFKLMDTKTYIPKPIRKLIVPLFSAYYKRALKKFSAVLVASPHIKESIEEYNKNVHVITNYPTIDDEEILNRWPDYKSKKVCFAGGIAQQWSHKETIDALHECKGVNYVLCGSGSTEYLNDLKKKPGWKQVDYRGRIPFSDVINVMMECSVGLVLWNPQNNRGGKMGTLGNTKMFEYMRAGLPIICTDFILWRQIVEKYNCGICVSRGDKDGLIKAIKTLTDNPGLAEQMGENARRAVLSEYNWKTQEKKLYKVYEQLLAE